jgi:hypothetical protein
MALAGVRLVTWRIENPYEARLSSNGGLTAKEYEKSHRPTDGGAPGRRLDTVGERGGHEVGARELREVFVQVDVHLVRVRGQVNSRAAAVGVAARRLRADVLPPRRVLLTLARSQPPVVQLLQVDLKLAA